LAGRIESERRKETLIPILPQITPRLFQRYRSEVPFVKDGSGASSVANQPDVAVLCGAIAYCGYSGKCM
jgi:hypothetical protein